MKPQKKYSEPKIFTGGVDISQWSKLKKSEQEKALSKQWYVYYSYRNPKTRRLERQVNIKGDANWYKTKRERFEILETYCRNLSRILRQGYNPYEDDYAIDEIMSVEEALAFGLNIKKKTIAQNSFIRFKSRIKRFEKYLIEKGYSHRFITSVDKKVVITYLNHVLDTSSPRNRNNTCTDISLLFQVFEDNDIVPNNFVSKINVLKAPPKRNKTYSDDKLALIYKHLEEKDPQLLLFIKFVSYNFLRPIEVCRLRVENINLKEKTLIVKAKNKLIKQKIIPQKLIDELPDLSKYSKDDFLFAPKGSLGQWDQ